jgi:hypothetical protein
MVNFPPFLRSYSPHPLDASFGVSTALLGFCATRYCRLSNLQVSTLVASGLACAALGALRFVANSHLQNMINRIKRYLPTSDWDVVTNPKDEVKVYARSIRSAAQRRMQDLEYAFNKERPLGIDRFNETLSDASENHPGASHFYRHFKAFFLVQLQSIVCLSGGKVARAMTSTGDYASAAVRAGGALPFFGAGQLFAVAGGALSLATNSSEIKYYQNVSKLFSDSLDATFFIRWMALYFTLACSEKLPYLDKKNAEDLAAQIAACVLEHLIYKRSSVSQGDEAPLNLLKEAKAIAKGIDWSPYQSLNFPVKKAIHADQVFSLDEILNLNT